MDSTNNFLQISNSTFVCIIMDDSGSMGEPAANSEEARGYTRNDFSCQGAKLCVNGAPDNMCMGVITFNSSASVVHPPVKLDSYTRTTMCESINRIKPSGGTNIYSAMIQANKMIDQVRDIYGITKCHIILFTDGEDTTLNESNIASYLSQISVRGEYSFTMDTVGFGPNANTQLLVRMASICGGTYALCYDASMVGTIFGRAIARTYIGSEAFGIYESDDVKSSEYYDHKDSYNRFRTTLSELLLDSYLMLSERVNAVDEFNTDLENWMRHTIQTNQTTQTDPDWYRLVCGLHSDLNNQIRLAVSNPNYWTMWGKAYWQMMGIALEKQYSPNFKDACLQIFGSTRAKEEYARISAIYNEMPMAPPSNTYYASQRTIPIALTTASFNSADSGCFHPDAKVLLYTGEYVSFRQLEHMIQTMSPDKQILLQSTNPANGKIVCLEALIKTDRSTCPTKFCKVDVFFDKDPVVLTPTHPVQIDTQWFHPYSMADIYEEQVDCVYNIVLKPDPVTYQRGQSIIVNGYECVCLAHGIPDSVSAIASDSFWGSEAIVSVIKHLYPTEYSQSLVNFTHKFKRNILTGWIDSAETVDTESTADSANIE